MKPTVTICGTIGPGQECTCTASGISMCKFTVHSPGAKDKPADVFPITAWRGLAELVPNIVGADVMVSCRVDSREYNGRHYLDLVADGIFFAAGQPEAEKTEPVAPPPPQRQVPKPSQPKLPTAQAQAPKPYTQPAETDEIPF